MSVFNKLEKEIESVDVKFFERRLKGLGGTTSEIHLKLSPINRPSIHTASNKYSVNMGISLRVLRLVVVSP